MPSATLATMTVATFSEMPSQPIRPSTAHTGSALAMIASTPNRADRNTTKITREHGQERRPEAAQLRDDDVVIERREDAAGAGHRRRDAAAGEHRRRLLLGAVDLLEHEIRAHRRELHRDLRARVVAGDDAIELAPALVRQAEDEQFLRDRVRARGNHRLGFGSPPFSSRLTRLT